MENSKGYDVRSIVLFGSVATGEARDDSDVDLLIVAPELSHLKEKYHFPPFLKPTSNTGHLDDAGGIAEWRKNGGGWKDETSATGVLK